MNDTENRKCQGCGAEITAQQIAQRQAGLVQGVLLCPNCVAAKRRQAMEAASVSKRTAAQPGQTVAAQAVATAKPAQPIDEAEVAISLIDDDEMPGSASTQIRSFASKSTLGAAHHDEKLKRALTGPEGAATRARTFHAKLTDAGLANLDDVMNEWLDTHPDVYIKSATSVIGIFEGKTKEPHMFITVFY